MTADPPALSFADPAVQRCPFAAYARLQSESPVYHDPGTGFYVVTRYDDVVRVNSDTQIFSNTTTQVFARSHSPVAAEVGRRYAEHGFLPVHTLVSNDPPSHTGYRGLVDRAFARRTVAALESGIRATVDALIDGFIQRGRVDFLADFAIPLPMSVIAQELGLPQKDTPLFKLWSDASIEQINPNLAPDRELVLTDLLIGMQQYLHRHLMACRERPAAGLLNTLAHAEIDGWRLSSEEMVNIASQLLVAGNETTTTTLTTAMFMLLEAPELRARLIAEPALIPAYVEEVLRLHAPIPHLYRQVLKDTELAGVAIPKGAVVMVVYGAGNRDPAKFPSPAEINLERANGRQHLSFGKGVHFCIGNVLSRTELRIALEQLLQRIPAFRLDPFQPAPRWAASFQAHALENLSLVF
jgi:cytochrome P450 family 142 subfamily A polypeptide 1